MGAGGLVWKRPIAAGGRLRGGGRSRVQPCPPHSGVWLPSVPTKLCPSLPHLWLQACALHAHLPPLLLLLLLLLLLPPSCILPLSAHCADVASVAIPLPGRRAINHPWASRLDESESFVLAYRWHDHGREGTRWSRRKRAGDESAKGCGARRGGHQVCRQPACDWRCRNQRFTFGHGVGSRPQRDRWDTPCPQVL